MTDPRNRIYSFALLKSFYDEGKDYIDAFAPLMMSSLPSDGRMVSVAEVQAGILNQTSLMIPELALGVIATRSKRAGLVVQRNHLYGLTPMGKKRVPSEESDREVQRKINDLVDDAKDFVELGGVTLTRDEIWTSLQGFIATNLQFFEQFAGSAEHIPPPDELSPVDTALLEYCCAVEESNPTQFRTLRDIVLGSVIATSVYMASFADVGRRFDRTVVYLDSNILFNLLELHYDQFNKPIGEMFELMVNMGSFDFRVFDFTVDELVGVLSGFTKRSRTYARHIRVNTIFSSLRSKGWTPSRVRTFIASVEEHLAERGIRVEPTDVDLDEYVPENGRRIKLESYKPNQPERGQNHDLAAVQRVRSQRKSTPRQIEKVGAFLLTADLKLARYNFVEDGHKERNTVSEVVPASVLTTFLWLKDPSRAAEVPLRSIIAMHSKNLLVDRAVWDQFFKTLRELRKAGEIDERGTSILLFDSQFQDSLKVKRPNQVTREWVLRGVEEARRKIDEEFARSAAERENELLARYEAEMAEQEEGLRSEVVASQLEREEIEERVLKTVRRVKTEIKEGAERETLRLLFLFALLLTAASGWVVQITWSQLSPLAGGISLVAIAVGVIFAVLVDTARIRRAVFVRVFDRIYRYRLNVSRVADLEIAAEGAEAPPASGHTEGQ